jgi:hypothetical protein
MGQCPGRIANYWRDGSVRRWGTRWNRDGAGTLMRTRLHPQWQRNGVYLGAALSVATLGLVATATPALAHANIIAGTSSCSTVPGADYQVTWTISNDWNLPETGHVTYATGGGATLSQTSVAIPPSGNGSGGSGQMPYQSVTVVQTLPQSVTGAIFLNTSSTYSDNYVTSNSGEITAPTNCPPALPPTTIPPPAPVGPATAALVSPTTIPVVVPSVAPPTTTIPTSPPATKLRVGNSINGAKRPTLLASTLPPSKPHAPIIKAASFTG